MFSDTMETESIVKKGENMQRHFMFRVLVASIFVFNVLQAADLQEEKHVKIVKERSHFRLGVVIKTLDSEKLKQYQLKGGVEVIKVLPHSAAAEAGLKKGDVIVSSDGKTIDEASTLREIITASEEQQEVKLNVLRDGKNIELKATLKSHEGGDEDYRVQIDPEDLDFHLEELKDIPKIIQKSLKMIPQKGGYLGIRGRTLSDQLKAYFEVENGVLIEEIIEDSPADSVGLKAGDVIIEIENKKIEDYSDLVRTLNYHDAGEVVKITHVRKGKEKEIRVKLQNKTFPHHGFKWIGEGEEKMIIKDFEKFHFDYEKMLDLEEDLKEMEEELQDIKVDIDIYFI